MKNIKYFSNIFQIFFKYFSNIAKIFILFLTLKIIQQHHENESNNIKRGKQFQKLF
jgi:hypothetical protein